MEISIERSPQHPNEGSNSELLSYKNDTVIARPQLRNLRVTDDKEAVTRRNIDDVEATYNIRHNVN